MSIVGRSERGYIIADTVLVMSAKQPRETTSFLNIGDKRKVCLLSGRKKEVQKEFTCCSCFDIFRHTYTVTCQHSYCKGCLRKMFQSGLKDRSLVPVKCCGKRIDQRLRRDVLSMEECTMFENILEEIESPHKMYCPNKRCGAFHNLTKVLADGDSSFLCRECKQRLCAKCRTTHPTLSCAAFQSLPAEERNPEDLALFDVAKRSSYARCNNCSSFVEKIDGCTHVRCRCGNDFCYVRQRYHGPQPSHDPTLSTSSTSVMVTEESAYALEESPCVHEWRGCNRVLDRPRLCHLCRQTKRCFQSCCTKCRLRVCAICLEIENFIES